MTCHVPVCTLCRNCTVRPITDTFRSARGVHRRVEGWNLSGKDARKVIRLMEDHGASVVVSRSGRIKAYRGGQLVASFKLGAQDARASANARGQLRRAGLIPHSTG
jgi:hypothetical protein